MGLAKPRTQFYIIAAGTRIKLEHGLSGDLLSLREGMAVEVKFNPSTSIALKIEIEEED